MACDSFVFIAASIEKWMGVFARHETKSWGQCKQYGQSTQGSNSTERTRDRERHMVTERESERETAEQSTESLEYNGYHSICWLCVFAIIINIIHSIRWLCVFVSPERRRAATRVGPALPFFLHQKQHTTLSSALRHCHSCCC